MTEKARARRVVAATGRGVPVPDPHPSDYSAAIPDATLKLIDEMCDQAELSSGKVLQRFEWRA